MTTNCRDSLMSEGNKYMTIMTKLKSTSHLKIPSFINLCYMYC